MSMTRREFVQRTATGAVAAVGSASFLAYDRGAFADENAIPVPEPRIARFERMAYGMFIHWGLYSQLGRGEWVMHREKIPKQEYRKLRETFTAKDFDGRKIALFFSDSW